jgi:hypothetical protein
MYLTITSQIISLGVTPSKLPPVPLEGRKYVTIQNIGGVFVYIGGTTVTANTAGTGGFQLLPKGTWSELYTDAVNVYGVVTTGSSQVYIEEGK